MILTYRQKLRPTKAQHRLLEERLERQRLLYNAALQERRDAWRLARKPITRLDQQKSLTLISADDPLGHGADPANMGRWTLKRVEDAFTGFFSRIKKGGGKAGCQTALNIDPGSASNFDPLNGYGGTPLISPAKRVGVAQPG